MADRQCGFRWVLVAGFALCIGCSEESAVPSAGSAGSDGNGNVVTAADASTASMPPKPSTPPTPEPREMSPEERIDAGRSVYNANCIACHGLDPTQDGALGPAVAGASLVLLEARVLRAEYPESYEPKRTTRVMIALPHLEPRLVELTAYLDSLD